MKLFVIQSISRLKGEVFLSGDKSIAHRAAILSALSRGLTRIENFPSNKDCQSTISVLEKLGIRITQERFKRKGYICVFGKGLLGLSKPKGPIFLGESGTTFRLLLGVLAGQNFQVKLTAGKSLSQRPMLRVTEPLRRMGAKIKARGTVSRMSKEEYPPIMIQGGSLKPISYKMPIASAQVKSAILLAGLYAKGETRIIEPVTTRDHTERMLKLFKAGLKVTGNNIVIKGKDELFSPKKIYVPGDISSASFFIVLTSLLKNSSLIIKNVSLNPGRMGVIKVLKRMGADIKVKASKLKAQSFEPMGDLMIKSSSLKGAVVNKEEIPSLIDELPILMVAACFAKGRTVFEGAGELRVKETDRINSMTQNLRKMGAIIKVIKTKYSENIVVTGVGNLTTAAVKSFGDHRTAMSMVIAGLLSSGKTRIDDVSCINKSFPDFLACLKSLANRGRSPRCHPLNKLKA